MKANLSSSSVPSSVPRSGGKQSRILIGSGGRLRAGWLLAITLIACAGLSLGLGYGLGEVFSTLFRVWNVNAGTVSRAPAWARMLYRWHGSLISLIQAAAVMALCAPLRRLWGLDRTSPALRGLPMTAVLGFVAVLAMGLIGLMMDSLRLEWPLTRPRFTPGQPLLLIGLVVTALSEEMLCKGIVYRGIRERWGGFPASICATALFFLSGGGYTGNAFSALNVLLMGLMTCCLYERWGLGACTGFRVGWSFAGMCVLGFGGGENALYKLYHISEAWLTGGDAGPIYGFWATLFLAGMLAALYRDAFVSAWNRLTQSHINRKNRR